MSRVSLSVGAAILLAATLSLTCGRSAALKPGKLRGANVLLITLDTTRADRIGAYGYSAAETPNLDRLAGEGVLFEHCITPSAFTLPSHSSIMTGLYPPHHGVRLNGTTALSDTNTTLAEQLSSRGYRTGAFAGAFVLDGRWGLAQGFEHYDDDFKLGQDQQLDLARVQRPANLVTDAALKWLQQDQSRPFFAWLHFYDAHTPYEPPEPYRARFGSRGLSGAYDGEIAFTDSQIGRLLDWIESQKLRENTIIVVVADHGEGLGSHGEGEHGFYVYDYAVRVPLIMRFPGTAGRRVIPQVRTVDILPTVMELLGGEAGTPAIQGESLMPLINGQQKETPRYAYSESMAVHLQYGWSALYSLRSDGYKFIEAPRAELYDLKQDPVESENRLDNLRRVAREMRAELKTIRDEGDKVVTKTQEANLDSETMRMLASLGYVGGTSFKPGADEILADPKDKLPIYESVGYAAQLLTNDKFAEAAEVLEIVLREDPKIPQAQQLLVTAYVKTNRVAKAKSMLDSFLKEDPGNVRSLIAMAEILLREGKRDEVIALSKRALAEDPNSTRAYELMADVHMTANEHEQAVPLLRRVVEIQPKLSRSRINLAAALLGLGQIQEAETLLQDILKQYPKFPLANFHLGLLREKQGRIAEARAAYETELAHHPKSVPARFNFGNLLLRAGDAAGAEQQMRTLIKEDPGSARPYLLLGQTLLNRPGQLAEVERLALAGLERATENDLKALGYFLLADVYSRQGRRAELRDAVQKGNHYRSLIRS